MLSTHGFLLDHGLFYTMEATYGVYAVPQIQGQQEYCLYILQRLIDVPFHWNPCIV